MTDSNFPPSHSLYANIFGYMGLPLTRQLEQADVFVVGLPYDLGTSGRSGTRSGPAAIRQASSNLRWEEKRWPWEFDVFKRLKIADYGDLEYPTGNHEAWMTQVSKHYSALLGADKTILSFGGDHFVTFPVLRAHQKQHGSMALIHFDAHTDTYHEPGSNYNHGNMFYFAPREGLIDPKHSIQIGIRTEYARAEHPFEVIDAGEANELRAATIVKRIKDRVGQIPCYLTFDIDCLDPAYAPGTGTPVAGGLSSDLALKIIRGLTGVNIVGMDLVEVAPSYDPVGITSLAGATLALEMLYVIAANR